MKRKNKTKNTSKLASKVIRARSESYTESDDASYASEVNSNDSSESSTATTASAASSNNSSSSSKSKNNVTSANNPAKCSITRVTIPRKIVIKYSATIESPVLKTPLAIIGQTNSESSDVVESDFSESSRDDEEDDEEEDEDEEDEEDEEEDETEQTNELLETDTESEADVEEENEEDEESTEAGSEADEESAIENGFASNVTKKSKGYDMDDFKILKTIGKC